MRQLSTTTRGDEMRSWNITGLQSEIKRQQYRAQKKLFKFTEKMRSESEENIENRHDELAKMQLYMEELNRLETALKPIQTDRDINFIEILPLIKKLNISDAAPERSERIKKHKQPQVTSPRKPYFVYRSIDGIDLYVGRRAEDNDELSCNPIYREDADWWLHVAGYAGSHVVIRSQNNNLPSIFRETVIDAAILAVINSKAKDASKATVHLTRCRNVSKPRGAKPGLVQLSGDVRSITINVKAESTRLNRLVKVEPITGDDLDC